MGKTCRNTIYPKVDRNKGGDIMENAAKALLIAGAVLIVIALISLGVYIISSQKGTIETSKDAADNLQITTYNSTFLKYVGQRKTGSEVKNLLIDIQTNNNRNADKQIAVTYNDGTGDINNINEILGKINIGKRNYTISAGYNSNRICKHNNNINTIIQRM